MKFTWKFCNTCQSACVICPKCGNNCCNGGYGLEGKCDICELAYQYQHAGYAAKIVPPKEELEQLNKAWPRDIDVGDIEETK